MNIQFNIEYSTFYGQDLILNLVTNIHKGEVETARYRMHTTDGYHWGVEINKEVKPGTSLEYFYSIEEGERETRREWSVLLHRITFSAENANACLLYTSDAADE